MSAGGETGTTLIWGSGAVGGVLGAHFARAGHRVLMVDRVAEHVAAMNADGLRIEGPVATFSQAVTAHTPDTVAGLYRTIILAVKAHHTEAALAQLLPHLHPDGCVVSAQNGLNEKRIAEAVGPERTVGCFVNFGADWLAPGRILFGNRAAVALGELDGRDSERLAQLHELFRLVEPGAVVTNNIWGYLWGKLGYGALLFATALTHASMADALAMEEFQAVYASLGREVMALARAEGVTPIGFNGFDPAAFAAGNEPGLRRSLEAMVAHNRNTAKTHSGIYRDLAVRRRKTEVDAQLGVLLPIAERRRVPLRAVPRLIELVHDVEAGRREQGTDLLEELLKSCS
ncbi:MAG: 2-dehydropantoate 2-reductase [Halieaceae bacterium]|nr:2-dehydropantoate 2-reductase [Halieaceae bacterium]